MQDIRHPPAPGRGAGRVLDREGSDPPSWLRETSRKHSLSEIRAFLLPLQSRAKALWCWLTGSPWNSLQATITTPGCPSQALAWDMPAPGSARWWLGFFLCDYSRAALCLPQACKGHKECKYLVSSAPSVSWQGSPARQPSKLIRQCLGDHK